MKARIFLCGKCNSSAYTTDGTEPITCVAPFAGRTSGICGGGYTEITDRIDWIIASEVERVIAEGIPTEEDYEPYYGWCEVEGCKNEGSSGGYVWPETGYWTVCSEHSALYRNHGMQPKMKQDAIDRENSRDKITGYLPFNSKLDVKK